MIDISAPERFTVLSEPVLEHTHAFPLAYYCSGADVQTWVEHGGAIQMITRQQRR